MFSRDHSKPNLENNNDVKYYDLFQAVQNKDKNKIIEYINNPDYKVWQIKDENEYTILHKSCFLDYSEISILIIKELKKRLGSLSLLASFINEKTDEGLTALHFTAYKGNIELSKFLIENGASLTAVTNLGKNVVHLSAEGNQPSAMIYFLYKEKFDVYTGDENGSSPLHWACYSGAEESVNFLIGLNAFLDVQDKEKLTPLHLATLYNREKIVIKLLQNGADKNLKNSRGELPIDIARKKNFHNLVEILKDKDYNPLCTLETPLEYINPSDLYKKFIIIMIVVPEIFIIFMILPYLEQLSYIMFNNVLFLIEILLIIILIIKDPGYTKMDLIDDIYSIDNDNNDNDNPLFKLIEKNIDIKHYCPKCNIPDSYNCKHCIICDKCVEEFSHHCFWLNKCIGRRNIIFYLLFILFSLVFSYHSIFICLYSLFDFVRIAYEKLIYIAIFGDENDRGIRVLSAALVILFDFIVSFPLIFLLLIEIIKLYNKRKEKIIKNIKIDEEGLELETKKGTSKNIGLDNRIKSEHNNFENDNENNDILGINRETNIISNEKEILLTSQSNIPMPNTPFSVEQKRMNEYAEE